MSGDFAENTIENTIENTAENFAGYAPGKSYDATPYPRMAHQSTHPMHLGALGTLLGIQSAPPGNCRLLDIGCATGSNIMPMAITYPGSTFVGIDVSPRQIEIGQADIAALQIPNAHLITADLMQLGTELGEFDYIIAHGFYSWVPASVRDRLLALIGSSLAPNGIALVSYNVYPGWRMMDGLRDMMKYHSRSAQSPDERIATALEILRFVSAALPPDKSPMGGWVNGFLSYIDTGADFLPGERHSYLLHDQLESVNQPVYFHEFSAHAARHGMQYLCDADIETDFPQGFPDGTVEALGKFVHSAEELQQYMDFARYRMFRRTLLVRDDLEKTRTIRPDRLAGLSFSSPSLPQEPDFDPTLPDMAVFRNPGALELKTDHPLSKAALMVMSKQWPRIFSLPELVQEASQLLGTDTADNAQPTQQEVIALCVTLMQGFTAGDNLVNIMAEPPLHPALPSTKPVGSRWARHELQTSLVVTNLRHERVRLEPLEAQVLQLLDGTHDAASLAAHLLPEVLSGAIGFDDGAGGVLPPERAAEQLDYAVSQRINTLSRAALLEA